MGITSITNLTPLPVARSIQADLEPLPMERVESSARTGDETYSPSGGKSAGGSEDDASEEDVFEDDLAEMNDESGVEQAAQPSDTSQPGAISFFA